MQTKQNKHQCRSYAVHPSAHRLSDGSFSSNVVLERRQAGSASVQYRFYSLDYFDSEAEAIQHSSRWARDWVETRG